MTPVQTVLFVIYNPTHFKELYRVIERYNNLDGITIHVVFESKYQDVQIDIDHLQSMGVKCFTNQCMVIDRLVDNMSWSLSIRKMQVNLMDIIVALILMVLGLKVSKRYVIYRTWETRNKKFLKRYQPDVLFLAEASLNLPTSLLWIKQARKHDIPSIIIPYGLMGLPYNHEMKMFYSKNSTHLVSKNGYVAKFIKHFMPTMVAEHKSIEVLRLPVEDTIVAKLTGIIPPLPWNPNSSNVSAIAVESIFMKELYLMGGFPENQLQLTGTLYFDEIFNIVDKLQFYRQALYKKYQVPVSHGLIVCGFPPDQFKVQTFCENGIDDFGDIINLYATIFSKIRSWTILVNPHPRIKHYDLTKLDSFNHIHLVYQNISDLIPLSDIYIAASSSSTIRTGIACGIPTINYDVYGYEHKQYSNVKSVLSIQTKNELIEAISKLTQDPDYYEEQATLARRSADHWGQIDGQAFNRLRELVQQLRISAS
ncbi:MAG: hypothetical protein Phog2KO_48260 [Phototrophicaceae bacterium]